MHPVIAVGLGGFAGAVARYALAGAVGRWASHLPVPLGTLAVNVLGCFLLGFLTIYARERGWLLGTTRLFLGVGFLGSFTTFSTFGQETIALLQVGQPGAGAVYVLLQVGVGLTAVIAGQIVAGWWSL